MQRIFNTNKWTTLAEGQGFTFSSSRPRTVRLEVNAPQEVRLYVSDGDQGEIEFLALVKGRDTVEFVTSGQMALHAEGGDVMIYTADGDDVSSIVEAPVIFTKIVERRRRSPEVEYMIAAMNANVNRRLEQQAHELERSFTRRMAAVAAQSSSPGPARGSYETPEQAGRGEPSPPPPAEVDRGDQTDA